MHLSANNDWHGVNYMQLIFPLSHPLVAIQKTENSSQLFGSLKKQINVCYLYHIYKSQI